VTASETWAYNNRVGLVLRGCQLDAALPQGACPGVVAYPSRGQSQGAEGLRESLARRFGLIGHPRGAVYQTHDVALQRSASSSSPVPHARKFARRNLTAARAAGVQALQDGIHPAQRADSHEGIGGGPMVDDPFGLPCHGFDQLAPSGVAWREHLHECIQDRERFPVRPRPSAWRTASRRTSIASSSPGEAERA
jgi:hypothetical protein